LIDVDSKIPNLALMKISAYHKQKGDTVGLNLPNPDKIYTSIVFSKNNGKSHNATLSPIPIEYGGTGYDLTKKLPMVIEYLKPDYDLYPSTYSQGFTTRGCNRSCSFCCVPKKEGSFQRWQHPQEFHDDRFSDMMLLDNNILLDKKWFKTIASWSIDNNVKINMTQGYDIRLIDSDSARLISEIHSKDVINFAFDDSKLESIIRKNLCLLQEAGLSLRGQIQFFVYCDSDLMFEDALNRCNILRELGTNAFLMFNCQQKRTKRIKNLQRWANRRWIYWLSPFNEYTRSKHT